MGRGSERRIVKDAEQKGTLHQFYKRKRSVSPKVRYNPMKDNYGSTSNLRRSSCIVSKLKTMDQSVSNKASNSGASKLQSS